MPNIGSRIIYATANRVDEKPPSGTTGRYLAQTYLAEFKITPAFT